MTSTTVWNEIRAGRAPTPRLVSAVVASEARDGGPRDLDEASRLLRSRVLGAGPLEDVLGDDSVTDVLVNGTGGVWIDRGRGLEITDVEVGDTLAVRRLAVRLAGLAERRLDEASPYVDGLLPGGIRLHAVLPPLVDDAAHISLRIPRRMSATLEELHRLGAFPAAWLGVLGALVTSRVSFVVGGGTGSGKTTLLSALLGEVDHGERLVVVEDVREICVAHPHVVRLQARPANVEGRGSIDMVTLVRQSLRMRPDRLVVGEVRGAEVREMLAALNTGHDGGCGTVHANSAADIVSRFEALGALAGMSPQAVRTQLGSAISVIVQVRRTAGHRYVESVAVLVRCGDGELQVLPALVQRRDGAPLAATSGQGMSQVGEPVDSAEMPGLCEPGWSALAALLDGRGAP